MRRVFAAVGVLLLSWSSPLAEPARGAAHWQDAASPAPAVSADFDGDGTLDVVVGDGTGLRLDLADGETARVYGPQTFRALVATDIDRDGDPDLVGVSTCDRLYVWDNDGGQLKPRPSQSRPDGFRPPTRSGSGVDDVPANPLSLNFTGGGAQVGVFHPVPSSGLAHRGSAISFLLGFHRAHVASSGSSRAPPAFRAL